MENWDRDDAGMWEVRGETPALHDVAADVLGGPGAHHPHRPRSAACPATSPAWSKVRDEIYERIMTQLLERRPAGVHRRPRAAPTLDAGVLLMPMVKFLSPGGPASSCRR